MGALRLSSERPESRLHQVVYAGAPEVFAAAAAVLTPDTRACSGLTITMQSNLRESTLIFLFFFFFK